MPVPSWSHSKDTDFRKCKRMFWLKHDQKIPEPERPLPPGKTEHANDRGTRIHDGLEHYVNGTAELMPAEAEKHFGVSIDLLRLLYQEGKVSLEGEWAMNADWDPTDWTGCWVETAQLAPAKTVKKLPDRGHYGEVLKLGKLVYEWVPAWLRLKLDALVRVAKTEAIVIDYKSGKKFGNEIKHAEQLQLYALVTFLRHPELERVAAELWYIDIGEITRLVFRRDQALRFREHWNKRGQSITSCTNFPPSANIFSCRWCPYGPWEGGTGHCEVGVR